MPEIRVRTKANRTGFDFYKAEGEIKTALQLIEDGMDAADWRQRKIKLMESKLTLNRLLETVESMTTKGDS